MVKHVSTGNAMIIPYQAEQLVATNWEFRQIKHFLEGPMLRKDFIRDCKDFEELCSQKGHARHTI